MSGEQTADSKQQTAPEGEPASLDALARDLVGDGQSPNLFFVTSAEARVLAVVATSFEDAARLAVLLGAFYVEDRLVGLVWERSRCTGLERCRVILNIRDVLRERAAES